ncbi:histidine kinase N-terminal 7TM domain-containing protein [Haloarcula onubensis]|uniref:histidine kinase n=1 Tax=Haloarcula onubensis TaxID=2950539 RepID=A0ABU2FQJ4_9EURY|nr:histidine kinase N-terminal 7TM domain-containing protein [Halomicroarcula sp. S3CR25-11]MDS0283018.1 ATP-binding protein [Halomicroarcula sp. S3CR25-11]
MGWQSSPYLLALFFAAVLAVTCGVYTGHTTRQRRKDYHTAFIVLCAGAAVWSGAYAVQVASTDLATKRLTYTVLHVGVAMVPTGWLTFALCYTGRSRWVTPRAVATLAAVPVALVLALPTNPGGVALAGVELEVRDGLVLLATESGPLYQLYLAYTFVVVPLGAALLVVDALGSTRNVRLQSALVTVGALVPLAVNVLHLLEIPPVGTAPVNLTPVSVAVAGVFVTVAIFRHQLLEIDPVARNAVFNHVREGVVVLDDRDRIVDGNPAAKRLFGTDLSLGTPVRTVLPAYDHLAGGAGSVRTVLGPSGDRVVELSRSSLDPGRDSGGWILLLYDVTERQRQRERLERQNERLDSFTKIVSHDLRNPLSVIAGNAALAHETGAESHFETIDRTVDRMDSFLDELLTLSRAGETVGDAEPVSVGAVVEDVRLDSALPGLSVVVDGDCVVTADRRRLTQLFDNLFRNAVRHGLDGTEGAVTVTVGRLPDGFYVADDGVGIPAETRETLFEYGTTTHRDGSGFGLGIVHDIVTAHGWSISVTEGEGGGARFEITGVEVASAS